MMSSVTETLERGDTSSAPVCEPRHRVFFEPALSSVRYLLLGALALLAGCPPSKPPNSAPTLTGNTTKPSLPPSSDHASASASPIQFLAITDRAGIAFRH